MRRAFASLLLCLSACAPTRYTERALNHQQLAELAWSRGDRATAERERRAALDDFRRASERGHAWGVAASRSPDF
jgi:hypothetical protein